MCFGRRPSLSSLEYSYQKYLLACEFLLRRILQAKPMRFVHVIPSTRMVGVLFHAEFVNLFVNSRLLLAAMEFCVVKDRANNGSNLVMRFAPHH